MKTSKRTHIAKTSWNLLIVFFYIILVFLLVFTGYEVSSNMQSYGTIINISGSERFRTYFILTDAENIHHAYLNEDMERYTQLREQFYEDSGQYSKYVQYMEALRDGSDALHLQQETDKDIIDMINNILTEMNTYTYYIETYITSPSTTTQETLLYDMASTIYTDIDQLVYKYEYGYNESIQYLKNLLLLIIVISILFAIFIIFLNRAITKFEQKARFDHLTGLRTIGFLTEDSLLFSSKKYSVIFIDLNKFKEINDTYGHSVGDDILKAIGSRITASFDNNFAYRYGGDEFLIFITEEYNDKIQSYIDSLKNVVFAPITDRNGTIHHTTGSIGMIGSTINKTNLHDAISQADSIMYKAKRNLKETFYYAETENDLNQILEL